MAHEAEDWGHDDCEVCNEARRHAREVSLTPEEADVILELVHAGRDHKMSDAMWSVLDQALPKLCATAGRDPETGGRPT